jgi:hypothetical protein
MSFTEFDQQTRRSLIEGSQIAAQAIRPYHFSAEAVAEYSLADASVSSRTIAASIQSDNYVAGVSGWKIERATGNVEFGSGTFRGSVLAGSIDIPDTTTASSFHVDSTGRAWIGANASNFATAPFRVTAAGAVTASSVTLTNPTVTTGTFTGPTIYIPDSVTYPRALLGSSTLAVAGALGLSLKNASGDNSAAEVGGTTGDISLYSGHVASGGAFTHVRAQASQVDVLANNGDSTVVTRVRVTPADIQLVDNSYTSASLYGLLAGGTSYTPTVTQVGTVGMTVGWSKYIRLGKFFAWWFGLTSTGAGTAGNNILVTLPFTVAPSSNLTLGHGSIADISEGAAGVYVGKWKMASTTTIGLEITGSANFTGANPNFALAASDELEGFIIGETT